MSKNFKSKKSSSNGKESGNCANSLKSTLQNKKVFRIPTHADGVLKELNKQRLEGKLCDVTVLVEHRRFQAHKCVLSANSTYFRNLLLTDNDGIFLRHVSAESFKAILDFMYTSRLELEPNTLQEVLKASKFLLIKSVVSICCRFLETQIKQMEKNLGKFKNQQQAANDPVLLSINSQLLKHEDPPAQAPHITFDPATGTFTQGNHRKEEPPPFQTSQHEGYFNQQRANNSYGQHLPSIPVNQYPHQRFRGGQDQLNYLHGKQLYNSHQNVQMPANHLKSNFLLPSPSYGDPGKNMDQSNQQCLPSIGYENKNVSPHVNGQFLRNIPQPAPPTRMDQSRVSTRKSLNMVYVDCDKDDQSRVEQGSCSRARTARFRHKSHKRANSPPVITLSINSKSVKSDNSTVSKSGQS